MSTPDIPSDFAHASQLGADAQSAPQRALRLVIDALRRRDVAIAVSLLLFAAIGTADYLIGHEIRLGIIYVLPVGYATWVCGRTIGFIFALLSPATCVVTFAARHEYSIFFQWDCVVRATTLLLFVELLARLCDALARSDERFVRVLDELYAAVYVADQHDNVLFANRRLVQLIGEGAKPPTASEIEARFQVVRPSSTRSSGKFEGFQESEVRDMRRGHWHVVREGDIPWVDRRRARLKMLTDITDQKQTQALQRQHQDALRHTSRLMDLAEAASTLAHELNQPLLAIVGYNAACIRLLESGNGDRELLKSAIEKCRAQAVRAGEIIHRLREVTSRRSPHLEACDVNAMIVQTLGWTEADVEGAQVSVELALSRTLPLVQADRVLIEQVIWNLVQNAVDSMRDAAARPAILRIESIHDGDWVKVTVSDTGSGISPEAAERLYAPFFTTKKGGLGLGLSICRSVVEMHGGRIWHNANEAVGASFHFMLPSGIA